MTSLAITHLVRFPPIQSSRHELQIADPVLELGSLGHGHDVIHFSNLLEVRSQGVRVGVTM